MRRCHQCGEEFSILRHLLIRGRFCSKKCFDANQSDEAHMRNWLDPSCHQDRISMCSDMNTFRDGVFKLQEGDNDFPLYFVNAGLLPSFRISQLMGPGYPTFGAEAVWPSAWADAAIHRTTADLPTLEQLLAPDVAQLRAHLRPSSRCALVGYSFGGLMAFEAAHQLRAEGVQVDAVLLLDTETKYRPPYEDAWQNLQKGWKRTRTQSIGSRIGSSLSLTRGILIKQIRHWGRRLLEVLLRDRGEPSPRSDEIGRPFRWSQLERIYFRAALSYQFRPLDCHGFLFRAQEQPGLVALDKSLGWSTLFSKGLEIIQVPGNHATVLLREPYNRMLAQEMKKVLRKYIASPETRVLN
jgi:thioesterase domain-containing protein